MSKKILIIDDDPTLIKVVHSLLRSKGYEVAVAFDGQEGLEAVTKEKPDLIVLDVQMPGMNGYTFVLELKKLVDIKVIPIIVLTVKDEMAGFFSAEGIRDYIIKPFQPEALLTTINKYL
jgi:CheY-like chemotaxis protein